MTYRGDRVTRLVFGSSVGTVEERGYRLSSGFVRLKRRIYKDLKWLKRGSIDETKFVKTEQTLCYRKRNRTILLFEKFYVERKVTRTPFPLE